jgi:hypothetical protein
MPASPLYERDFYAWANEQAALLRARKLGETDIEHIAEEIESMGRTEKRELISRLTVLMLHLLKWQYQPGLRGPSWRAAIRLQRRELQSHLGDNPSLKALLPEAIERAYGSAVIAAEAQTGLAEPTFPAACPWSFDEMRSQDFWPEGRG